MGDPSITVLREGDFGAPSLYEAGLLLPPSAPSILRLGVQSLSPFVIRKGGHIWRIWAVTTQTLMPKSTKVAQIHLPECISAKISATFPQNLRQNLPNFGQKSPNLPNFVSKKGSNFEHPTQEQKSSPKRKLLGRRGISGGHSRGHPGPKLRSGPSKHRENKHFCAHVHDPKALSSTVFPDIGWGFGPVRKCTPPPWRL